MNIEAEMKTRNLKELTTCNQCKNYYDCSKKYHVTPESLICDLDFEEDKKE
jgi:hypothetical protein